MIYGRRAAPYIIRDTADGGAGRDDNAAVLSLSVPWRRSGAGTIKFPEFEFRRRAHDTNPEPTTRSGGFLLWGDSIVAPDRFRRPNPFDGSCRAPAGSKSRTALSPALSQMADCESHLTETTVIANNRRVGSRGAAATQMLLITGHKSDERPSGPSDENGRDREGNRQFLTDPWTCRWSLLHANGFI
ncbi:hypothetical protein GWI33_017708 [Rhynchophorus ferrugineus]|uniref:Uncharacterized protein n=1 Tax=Rhynchophorus ferrugineus TaxID=354439 RepID=A0A834HUY4_RHYFE|nr:hypothetical protein GWI33_017708 [Rhynchophorus ferrugineus]